MAADDPRALFLRMDEILDAMDTHGDGAPEFFLNTETGEVSLWIDPIFTGEENDFDPEEGPFERIPTYESRDEYAGMEAFAAEVNELEVRLPLERALKGKGPFAGFRAVLAGYPDLQVAWQHRKRDRLLEEALLWLRSLDIEPQYELRAIVPVRPPPDNAPARVGLFDLLLLGAPDGKTELVDGRVERRFQATDLDRARTIFTTTARQLCELHGQPWRRHLVEDTDCYEIDRFVLTRSGSMVTLSVAVTGAVWSAFFPDRGQSGTKKQRGARKPRG